MLELEGPFPLTWATVDTTISESRPGVFMLGNFDRSGRFTLDCVGRADSDLQEVLKSFDGKHSHFCYSYASSRADAFIMECELFHRQLMAGRQPHPSLPDGLRVVCPVCGFHDV